MVAAFPLRRAAVTGGTGFVGANLVRRLLDEGCDVHLLLRPGHADWRIADIRGRLTQHVLDIADPAALDRVLRIVRPDCLFHLAAHGAYSWQRDAAAIRHANLLATQALARAALGAGVPTMVHAGSSSEYGRKDHAPAEDEPLAPEGDYAVTKAAATAFCRDFARREGMRIPTLRLYSAYGPWEAPERLVPRLVAAALEGRLPPLAAPDTARDFVAAEDVAVAFMRAATRPLEDPGAVINIGTGRQTRLQDIVALMCSLLPVADAPCWHAMPDRAWDTDVWVADSRRADQVLGWRATTPLDAGLSSMIAWMRSDPVILSRYRMAVLETPPPMRGHMGTP